MKTHADHNAAQDICRLIKWLEALEQKGGKGVVDNVDARALGRVARTLRNLYEALDALVANVEEQARIDYGLASRGERFEGEFNAHDPQGYEVWSTGRRTLGLCSPHSSEEQRLDSSS